MSSSSPDPTALTQTFRHNTSTHSYAINWTSFGSPNSPPLIFVHGTPWSSRVWVPYALSLSRSFHVYLADNPGFGESPLGIPLPGKVDVITEEAALDADLAQQSEAWAALYKHWEAGWDGRKAHVVAHDHGGLMALRANLLHGCEYASLCLIDVVAIGPFGQPLFKLVAENQGVFQALPESVFEGILESYIRDAVHKPLRSETMETLKSPWMRPGGKKGFIRQLCQANSRRTDEVEGRYGEIGAKMPVMIVWAKQDRWIPVETAERLRKMLKAKEVVVIEEAGHLVMYDQAARLGVELGSWLSTCGRS
jgi:pimeloyl-ACP methyl ester carboxylesterase